MSQPPSTPVKVPSAAANYTPATLDPDLRSSLNTILLRDGHVAKIQESLLHALNANHANWPTAIQSHALSLLHSGEVTSFPALLRRVLDDVTEDTNAAAAKNNGAKATNGESKKVNGAEGKAGPLAVPDAVVQEALRVTRESLEAVCEIEEAGGGNAAGL